jgi:hypothetical protein
VSAGYITHRSAAALEGLSLAYLKMSIRALAEKRGKVKYVSKDSKEELESIACTFTCDANAARHEVLKEPSALKHFGNTQVPTGVQSMLYQ